MFVRAFQHDLKARQFNESLAKKYVSNMDEVIAQAICYIKGEESNRRKDLEMKKRKCEPRKKELDIGRNTLSQDPKIDQ